jgi:hypothetical protein
MNNAVESEMCTCSTCGFQWKRGLSGTHSCAAILKARLDALLKEKFVVVAGKYESPEEEGDDGRNYKFSGEPKSNLTEAITELLTVSDYHFSEIEFRDANGKHWIVSAYPDKRPRFDKCKHCSKPIMQRQDDVWVLNTKRIKADDQYCWMDPEHGSQLHEPD